MAGVSERDQGATERLKPVRGIEVVWRGVYEVDHAGQHYAVEVDYFDFAEKVRLYRDGTRVDTRKSPARFEIDAGTTIEASMGLLGMKTLRLVKPGGETPLATRRGRRGGTPRRLRAPKPPGQPDHRGSCLAGARDRPLHRDPGDHPADR
jgi:hypothetical protein